MDEKQIYEQLEAVKRELAGSDLAEDSRAKVLGLIDRMEEQMHSPEGERDSLADQFEVLATEFEVSHPTLTGVVKNLMLTLGNMGV